MRRRERIKVIEQHDLKDCGAACLSMIGYYYNLKLPISYYRQLLRIDNSGVNIYGVLQAAEQLGYESEALEGEIDDLKESLTQNEIKTPFIARISVEEMFDHYVVVYKHNKKGYLVGDPSSGVAKYIKDSNFAEIWGGQIITFKPTNKMVESKKTESWLYSFWKLMIQKPMSLITAILLSAIISVVGVVGTTVFQYIIDDFSAKKIIDNKFYLIGIALVMMYLFRGGMQLFRAKALNIISKNVDVPTTMGYYEHIVDLPCGEIESRQTGEFLSRFNDTSKIRDAVSNASITLFLDTFMLMICGAYLFLQSKILFGITCVIVSVYGLLIILFVKPIEKMNRLLMEKEASITSFFNETIKGIETLKSFGREEEIKSTAREDYEDLVNQSIKGTMVYTYQEVLSGIIASVGTIILLWSGCCLMHDGKISLGALITCYSLMVYFFTPVQNLINMQSLLQTAVVAYERLKDIMDLKTEREAFDNTLDYEEAEGNGDFVIFDDVHFRYGYRDWTLKGVSFSAQKGEKIALVGESGSGKTTIAKLLMKFYLAEKGSIKIKGIDVSQTGIDKLREKISYVSQDVFLVSDSIINNITMGNRYASMDEIKEVCKKCAIDSFIESLPFKYDTLIEEGGKNLSGGQRQRIALARALLKKPDILILDEATSNMDSITENEIKNMIFSFGDDITCIVIAHRISTVKNCDTILVVKDGTIKEEGSHEELIERKGLYYKMYNNV